MLTWPSAQSWPTGPRALAPRASDFAPGGPAQLVREHGLWEAACVWCHIVSGLDACLEGPGLSTPCTSRSVVRSRHLSGPHREAKVEQRLESRSQRDVLCARPLWVHGLPGGQHRPRCRVWLNPKFRALFLEVEPASAGAEWVPLGQGWEAANSRSWLLISKASVPSLGRRSEW